MPNDPVELSKATTLTALRRSPADEAVPVRMGFESIQGFELMQRGAKLLASSSLVPTQFQGNLANCVVALNMANRIGADPLLVMQNLYVVHGRPGWSAKFLIASFNQCGRFSAIRFEWSGTPNTDAWGCRAYATERETKDKIYGPTITIKMAKDEGWYNKSGSKWKTIPELMLQYRAAAWMVNTHAPEISMGLNTAEEITDVYDMRAGADGTYATTSEEIAGALAAPAAGVAPAEDTRTLLEQVRDTIKRADEAGDSEIAYLALDDCRPLIAEMSDENQKVAHAEVAAASERIKARAD